MNVIGIIQTDLNEFNVLFEQQGGQGGNGQGQQSHDGGQNNQQDQDSDSMFLSFLDEQPSSNEHSGHGNSQGGQQQNGGGPQELTVRIKGIPEGQKANFLQMYQILQDAQDSQTLEKDLTIVDHGDQDQGSQKQGQGHSSGKQNKTTH